MVIRLLRVRGEDARWREEMRARQAAARSALDRLDAIAGRDIVSPEIVNGLRTRYLRRAEQYGEDGHEENEGWAEEYRAVRREVLDAERQALIDLRDRGIIGDAVLRKIQHQLDLEQVRLDAEMP